MELESYKKEYLNELNAIKFHGSNIFVYPFIGRSTKSIICYYFVYFLHLLTLFQLTFTLCLTGLTDWLQIINFAPNIGACLLATIKYRVLYTNKEIYDKIFNHFRDNLWDLIPSESPSHIETFIKYVKWAKNLHKFLLFFTIGVIVLVDSFPLLIMNYEHRILGNELQNLYPFDAWYPFDKVKWYTAIYIWEGSMTAMVVLVFAMANLIHAFYIFFICMELTLLGNSMKNLITEEDIDNINKRRNLNETHGTIKKNLKYVIKRHANLYTIASGLDTCLGDVMFIGCNFAVVFICLTAFTCMVVDGLYEKLRYFSFFLSLLTDTFIQCMMGEVLINYSLNFSEQIYGCDWVYADHATKKMLTMFLMRSQAPFKLSGRGCFVMNLNTYSRICSTSYQFFNLLRTVYDT